MRDDLVKMRECGKKAKMLDFPHDCGMVDTYACVCVRPREYVVALVVCARACVCDRAWVYTFVRM